MTAAAPPSTAELLAVRGLTVTAGPPNAPVTIVDDLDLTVMPGETLALVGESGCGKTTAALSLMGLLPPGLTIVAGSVRFDTAELTALPRGGLRQLRGAAMAMVFQDPMSALNPLRRVGRQIAEAIRIHDGDARRGGARQRAVELLHLVGIPDPQRRAEQFPHEYSGGMRQRAMIAMAIANRPRLLIADEPTTALDVTIQAQIVDLLIEAKESTGAALILVTHDLGLVGDLADRVAVMYAGRLVEVGDVATILERPQHPYTVGLLNSLPRLGAGRVAAMPIAGQAPLPGALPAGCAFHPRCTVGRDRELCRTERPPLADHGATTAACHFPGELSARVRPVPPRVADAGQRRVLLRLTDVRVEFAVRGRALRRKVGRVRAVDGVDLEIASGQTVALVGESGSGKTTLARAIVGLEKTDAGTIELDGFGDAVGRTDETAFRRRVQLVFQDPYASLNPRIRLGDTVGEPLRVHRAARGDERDRRIAELFSLVGLDRSLIARYPHQLSGGQRQRVGIARALALDPELLILDEPVSALDVSVQAQILMLLERLRDDLGLTYLFISHDLAVVERIAERVAVMYFGRIVEIGATQDVLGTPAHPYTRSLIAATPGRGRRAGGAGAPRGEPPSPLEPPSGCTFRSRCPYAIDACATTVPALEPVTTGSRVACIRADELEPVPRSV